VQPAVINDDVMIVSVSNRIDCPVIIHMVAMSHHRQYPVLKKILNRIVMIAVQIQSVAVNFHFIVV